MPTAPGSYEILRLLPASYSVKAGAAGLRGIGQFGGRLASKAVTETTEAAVKKPSLLRRGVGLAKWPLGILGFAKTLDTGIPAAEYYGVERHAPIEQAKLTPLEQQQRDAYDVSNSPWWQSSSREKDKLFRQEQGWMDPENEELRGGYVPTAARAWVQQGHNYDTFRDLAGELAVENLGYLDTEAAEFATQFLTAALSGASTPFYAPLRGSTPNATALVHYKKFMHAMAPKLTMMHAMGSEGRGVVEQTAVMSLPINEKMKGAMVDRLRAERPVITVMREFATAMDAQQINPATTTEVLNRWRAGRVRAYEVDIASRLENWVTEQQRLPGQQNLPAVIEQQTQYVASTRAQGLNPTDKAADFAKVRDGVRAEYWHQHYLTLATKKLKPQASP